MNKDKVELPVEMLIQFNYKGERAQTRTYVSSSKHEPIKNLLQQCRSQLNELNCGGEYDSLIKRINEALYG